MNWVDKIKQFFTRERYIHSTVRPTDVAQQGRYVRVPYTELTQRYSGYVKVAASRNAAAVASLRLRVYRRADPNVQSAFEGRRLKRDEVLRLRRSPSMIVSRSAQRDDGDLEEITDRNHPVVSMLERANPRDNWYELCEAVQLWAELTGNGYIAAVRGMNGWPIELWPLASQYVRALPDRERFISGYVYGTGFEVETKPAIDADDVVHLRFPNPLGDPYYGMGPLSACVTQADICNGIGQFQLATLDNGAQPGFMAIMPGSTVEQQEIAQINLDRKMQGVTKAGRTLVIGGPPGTDIKPWTMPQQDLNFLQGLRDAREWIANAFDMPVSLLTMESAALATAEKALKHWHQISIKPRAQRLADKLSEKLLPMFGPLGEGLFLCFDDPESDTVAEDATAATTIYSAGLSTMNEARAAVNLPPRPDGDTLKAASPSPFDLGGLNFGLPGKGPPAPQDKTETPAKPAPAGGEPKSDAAPAGEDPPTDTPRSVHFPLLTRDDRLTGTLSPIEQQMTDALARWFRFVLGDATAFVDFTSGIAGIDLNTEAAYDSLTAAIGGKQSRAFITAWNDAVKALGSDTGSVTQIVTLTKDAEDYLASRRMDLLKSVSQAVNEQLTETLSEGIKLGEGVPQLTDRVRTTVDGITDYGAERIARTESSRAYNSGKVSAWQESGIITEKRWVLSGNPCQFCRAMHGQVRGLDEPFLRSGSTMVGTQGGHYTNTYDDCQGPPLHPNCACQMVAVRGDK